MSMHCTSSSGERVSASSRLQTGATCSCLHKVQTRMEFQVGVQPRNATTPSTALNLTVATLRCRTAMLTAHQHPHAPRCRSAKSLGATATWRRRSWRGGCCCLLAQGGWAASLPGGRRHGVLSRPAISKAAQLARGARVRFSEFRVAQSGHRVSCVGRRYKGLPDGQLKSALTGRSCASRAMQQRARQRRRHHGSCTLLAGSNSWPAASRLA